MNKCSVKPYSGDEGFIFISYSHKDKEQVFPIIERMAKDGYRIWYDEGIAPGSEWPEFIAKNLGNCSLFLAFISENSLASNNCRREINYALHKQKVFVSVHLRQVEMTPGMEMQLSANQAIFKYAATNEEAFFEKLYATDGILSCKGESQQAVFAAPVGEKGDKKADIPEKTEDVPPVIPQPQPEPKPAPKVKRKGGGSKASIICGVILVFAVLVFIICIFAGNESKDDNSNSTVSTSLQTESSTVSSQDSSVEDSSAEDKIVMSDNPFDFTVKIEGDIYQLPCRLEEFLDNGWVITDNDFDINSSLPSEDNYGIELSRRGKFIKIGGYNIEPVSTAIKDCPVGMIHWYNYEVDIELAKGITAASDADDIIAAYGEPVEHSKYEEYDLITYYEETMTSIKAIEFHTYHTDKESSSMELLCLTMGNKTK